MHFQIQAAQHRHPLFQHHADQFLRHPLRLAGVRYRLALTLHAAPASPERGQQVGGQVVHVGRSPGQQFANQPVGLTTLAHACGEEPSTIEDAYEPFLLRDGLLIRTPRGRIATERAYHHLGLTPRGGGLV